MSEKLLSETTHSPGPWKLGGASGRMVYDAQNYNVADCDLLANAQLIAAAPQLLDCVRRVAKNSDVVGVLPVLLMQDIVAVLAKIEGRP